MKTKTFPIFLVFLCMGFGDVVGPLVGSAKDTFVPLIMGQVSDVTNVLTGFIVPLFCLLYIAVVSFISIRRTA
ncbi:MAG: hypothetical protein HYS25_09440 [Ignavibacteriales bacterium]|nr:hypothetical protein [Ignavibacteriales bacterium]